MDEIFSDARESLAIFCKPSAQVQRVTITQGLGGRQTESWANIGDPFDASLYSPKGDEIPAPLALLNRTIFWLAGDYPEDAKASDRVNVDGQLYEIHDVPNERTNQFYPRMMVSRLK